MNGRKRMEWMAAMAALSVVGSLAVSAAFDGRASADPTDDDGAAARAPASRAPGATASEGAPEAEAPPGCAIASGQARLIRARRLCTDCAPRAAVLELTFDRVADARAAVEALRVEPAVALEPRSDLCARRVLVGGDFEPQTAYRLTVPAVGEGAPRTFDVGTVGGDPSLRMPGPAATLPADGELPIQLDRVRRARLRIVPLDADEIAVAAEVGGVHPADRDPFDRLPDGWRGRAHTRALDPADGDEEGVQRVDPFALAGDPAGPVLVVADAPGVSARAAVVQRATHAVVLKVGHDGGLVWVADARTGRPVRGAAVTVYRGTDVRRRGRTDASGLLRLPGADALRGRPPRPTRG
ncbi:MAG TPA: hypothetical protein RMH99_26840, partial [Sandaracinaceae bacterium LLY-WYZ-13_1]|nr:hypothetical protein [Sandaracinaceae bacterium LLY-WYZ-13_1]